MTDDQKPQFNSEQVRDLLSPYLDNEVTAEERRLVEQGLAASAELRQELESLRQTVAMVTALLPVPAPRPFTLTEAQVRPPAPPARKGLFGLPWWVQGWATVATTLLCVLAVGGLLWSTQMGQNRAMPAAEIANAPAPTALAPERDAAGAGPSESPAQKPAAGSLEQATLSKEAAADEVQVQAVPAATLTPQATATAPVGALAQEEARIAEVTATPTAGQVTTLAESQPAPPPAADQEAATQSLAAAPPPAPALAPNAAAPAMKESAGAAQAVEAPPAEIPPTDQTQTYAAPAQPSAPAAATGALEAQAQESRPTATAAPPTATPTPLLSPTPLAMLTPLVSTPAPAPTAAGLPSTAASPEGTPIGSIIAVILAVGIIFVVIWLNRNRRPR